MKSSQPRPALAGPSSSPAPGEAATAVPDRSTRGLAIAFMLFGMLVFSLNDVMGKWLVSTYSAGQVIFLRSAAALVILVPILMRGGLRQLFHLERPGIQFLRVLCSTIEIIAFYVAVTHLPLADVMTYWLAAPIYVAALSPLLLGEGVGWRRWTAIACGFAGVVIALEPSAQTLGWPALLSIFGSAVYSLTIVFGRTLRGTPDTVLVFWHIFGNFVVGLFIAPFGWVTPDAPDLALLSLLGAVAMGAHICVNRSLKLADASDVAPMQYTLLFWAIVFGWLIFGDVPRPAMLIGAAIIIASGLFIVFREKKLGRTATPVEPTA